MKVSLCITCMGRLHHLKQTFFKNLEDNENCEQLEFVLLDYNCPDGTGEWARKELSGLIRSGRVVYYREKTVKYYSSPHSKNLAHDLAGGDVLVNLDADNFTGAGYAESVRQAFEVDPFLVGQIPTPHRGLSGRVAIGKTDFHQLRGYDESFTGWGFDDLDFVGRARQIGLKLNVTRVPGSGTIDHSENDRISRFAPEDRTTLSNERNRLKTLKRSRSAVINPNGYAKAVVYRNFTNEATHAGRR